MKVWVLLERHEEQPKGCYSVVSVYSSMVAAQKRKAELKLDDEENVWYYRVEEHGVRG